MTQSLRRAALGSTAWAAVNRLGGGLLRVGGRLLLLRLLSPEDFGLFTLAMAVVAAFQVLCQLELHQTVIQRRTLTPLLLSTAYWSQGVLSGAGTIALLILAGPLGALTGYPQVAPLLRALSIVIPIGGLSAVPRAWLSRELAFRQLAYRELAGEGIGTAAAVGAALAGAGVWSLVVHALVSNLVELLLLWVIVPWRPQGGWSRQEFRDLLSFGWPLLGRKGVEYLFRQGDRLLVGRAFGPEALGLYALGLRVMETAVAGIGAIFERVAFPIFARTQDDAARSRRGFLEAARVQALLTVPLVAGLGLLARDLVPGLLGGQWAGAAPFVQISGVRAIMGSLIVLPRATLLGRGRPGLVLGLSASRLGMFALGWTAGARWGPLGVAGGGAVAAALVVPVALRILAAELPVSARDWGRALLPAAVGAGAMGLGVIAVPGLGGGLLPSRGLARAGALLLIGCAAYVLPLIPWLAGEARRYLDILRAPGAREAPDRTFGPFTE